MEISKSRWFRKPNFKALLSANKNASSKGLFGKTAQQRLLFHIKPKSHVGGGRGYRWTDADGGEIALEYGTEGQHKLFVTARMEQEMRDALAAVWTLRLWHDTAESRQARSKCELWTPFCQTRVSGFYILLVTMSQSTEVPIFQFWKT